MPETKIPRRPWSIEQSDPGAAWVVLDADDNRLFWIRGDEDWEEQEDPQEPFVNDADRAEDLFDFILERINAAPQT